MGTLMVDATGTNAGYVLPELLHRGVTVCVHWWPRRRAEAYLPRHPARTPAAVMHERSGSTRS